MSNFYTLLTRVGAALHANAQVNQTTVPWTHMRLGDGNGAAVVPTENQTGLVRQVHTLQITDIAVHPDNPNWVIAEAVVPSDVGGWTVRETAIYGGVDGNTCIAVGNYPETYKPVLAEGAGREMVMRMVVQISSVATVKLLIDPAVAIASRAWVESLKATPQKAGLVKLADIPQTLEGERGDVAVTPQGLQAALEGTGGLPRFTPYVWGGRGDAMPEGDTQSSGQQLLDLMYPDMRADVVATQFTCTEAEWQADPYKRVTHWSLGDGVSWMRPPDKNGVQPGNVGAFYGVGSNPAGDKTGAAVGDAIRNITGELVNIAGYQVTRSPGALTMAGTVAVGAQAGSGHNTYSIKFDASLQVPTADENRPRTWYGIWMIRMYGRVVNTGLLDAPALNARMDMMDARVATLEAIPKPPGYQQVAQNITASTVTTTYYPNATTRVFRISVAATAASPATVGHVSIQRKLQDGSVHNAAVSSNADGVGVGCEALIYPGESWAVSTRQANLVSVIKTS